jgi:hypothetical protein
VRQFNALIPSAAFFQIVHASLMSKVRKKFPHPRSISLCFVNLITMTPPAGTGARKPKHRPLAESRIAGRHLLGQVIQRTASLEVFRLLRCGLNNADQAVYGNLRVLQRPDAIHPAVEALTNAAQNAKKKEENQPERMSAPFGRPSRRPELQVVVTDPTNR